MMPGMPEELEQQLKVPKIEVVTRDGKPTSIDDYDTFMQFLMQASATTQLLKLRKLEESKVPTKDKPLKITVSDIITEIPLFPPWISFSLINDGAGAVTVWVNDKQDPLAESMVRSSGHYNCNMVYPVIKALYLKAASGTTAAVRIYGKEGKPS